MGDLRRLRRRQVARAPDRRPRGADVACHAVRMGVADTACRGPYFRLNTDPAYVCAKHWAEHGYERDPTPY